MSIPVQPPYQVFFDRNGLPLEDGFIWIGQANLPPETNPIAVYTDEALTAPIVQPLRTINGYISDAGTPVTIYVSGEYSILVQDQEGLLVYSLPSVVGYQSSAPINNVLLSNGIGNTPIWGKVGLTTHVSGILPTANGGTGVAASGSTGTVNVVLSDSPTLTTPTINTSTTLVSTDAGATDGPQVILSRNSASPAASDELGSLIFNGRDSGAAAQQYAELGGVIVDPTAGSEDGAIAFKTTVAGTVAERARIAQGLVVGNPTGGDKGAGRINATGVYRNNVQVAWGSYGCLYLTSNQTGITTNTKILFDASETIIGPLVRGTLSTVNSRYTNGPTFFDDNRVLVIASVEVDDFDTAEEVTLTLRMNNTTVLARSTIRNDSGTSNLQRTVSLQRIVYVEQTDYLEIFLEASAAVDVVAGISNSYFQVWEIG